MSGSHLMCYACGHEYQYLGRDLHPGQCPRCTSYCVSPAGEVTVAAGVDVSSPEMPPQVTMLAIDERYRHYLYHFTNDGSRFSLGAVQVDGHFVRPINKPWQIPLPDSVRNALTQAEYVPASNSLRDGGATNSPSQ